MPHMIEPPGLLLYTRIRKSPYFYAHQKHGPKLYSTYNHMYHARHYGDPVEEYWKLLNGDQLDFTYTGPRRLQPEDAEHVEEIVKTGDFEAVVTWAIGLAEERPFHVRTADRTISVEID